MPSQSSNHISRVLRRRAEGLSVPSQIKFRLGRTTGRPSFCGVRLKTPDDIAAWHITQQIADGEYSYPGFVPERGWRVVDIGANVGVFALWAEHKGASVTAYEPGPATFECLDANARARRISAVHAAVVGESDGGTVELFLHPERSTRNSLIAQEIGTGEALEESVSVRAVGIAEVLSDQCDLLKVDCEGAEFEIFRGATPDVLRRAHRIVLEFHRNAGPTSELLDMLQDAGFTTAILEGADESAPFGVIGATRNG